MSKYCINCGTEIDESVKFCPSCGTAQDAPMKAANYASGDGNINVNVHQKMPAWAIVLIVLAAIVLLPIVSCIGCAGCLGCAAIVSEESTSETDVVAENTLRDCVIAPVGYEAMVDFEGNPVVCITYEFTNNSDSETSFEAFTDTVYQDGVQLEVPMFLEDGYEYDAENTWMNIQPGITHYYKQTYTLRDTSTPIHIEIEPFVTLSDEKISFDYDIAELYA